MPGKVIFVNRYAHPDISATSQMLSDLAFALAESGMEIHIVTSRLRYDDAAATLPPREQIGNLTIHRVWTSRFGRASLLGRLSDYFTFYLTAPLKASRLARRGDVIVAKTDPPLISIPLAIVSRLRGAHLVNWLQDVFPEVATALGMRLGGGFAVRLLTGLRNRSLRSAAVNVALGTRMAEHLRPQVPNARLEIISNWSPTADIAPLTRAANPLARHWHFGDRFVIGYSGNLGRAHELGVLLEAAERLRHRPNIVFLIIGEGNQKEALQAETLRRGLANVLFKPYQPKEQLKYSLTLPDVHLVSLKPALEGLIVPSKFYSSIAAARPVIFIGGDDGEIARALTAGDCGMTIAPADAAALAKAIERLCDNSAERMRLGANARAYFERTFDQPIAIEKWRRLLADIA